MEKIKRNERIGVIVRVLSDAPNRLFSLATFAERFGAAKSTISEDLLIVRDLLERNGLGRLETITGAAGGVRFIAQPRRAQAAESIARICEKLMAPDRILPGGYLFMTDVLSEASVVARMGEILAAQFVQNQPDFVLTAEAMGIPVGLMTARALSVPLIIARRDNRAQEGSVVSIHHLSGSSGRLQSMSLSKRAVKEGQRALIIDDFMKGGGTGKGLTDLMREFAIKVVGMGVVIETEKPKQKLVSQYLSLMTLGEIDDKRMRIDIRPSPWLTAQ